MDDDVKEAFDDIKNNHLKSIYGKIELLNGRVWYILGALAMILPLVVLVLSKVW